MKYNINKPNYSTIMSSITIALSISAMHVVIVDINWFINDKPITVISCNNNNMHGRNRNSLYHAYNI